MLSPVLIFTFLHSLKLSCDSSNQTKLVLIKAPASTSHPHSYKGYDDDDVINTLVGSERVNALNSGAKLMMMMTSWNTLVGSERVKALNSGGFTPFRWSYGLRPDYVKGSEEEYALVSVATDQPILFNSENLAHFVQQNCIKNKKKSFRGRS